MQSLILRFLAGFAAPAILASTISQGWLSTQDMIAHGGSVLEGVWRYLGYFTVLTNLLVAAVLARAAFKPVDRAGLNAPHVELMAATSILFVACVYNALLASQWDPQGLQRLNDDVLHIWSPLVFAAFWLLRPRGALSWRDALFAATWPAAYAVYGLTRGALDGFYPYFFMDPSSAPLIEVVRNMVLLIVVFVLGAMMLTGFDHVVARNQPKN